MNLSAKTYHTLPPVGQTGGTSLVGAKREHSAGSAGNLMLTNPSLFGLNDDDRNLEVKHGGTEKNKRSMAQRMRNITKQKQKKVKTFKPTIHLSMYNLINKTNTVYDDDCFLFFFP